MRTPGNYRHAFLKTSIANYIGGRYPFLDMQHVMTFDQFTTEAKALRKHFDACFENPFHAHPERFSWDFWHVPGQYTHLRTPAHLYFPEKLYMKFHKELVMWGRRNLGCWDISPAWLSSYVEGCKQEIHCDVPHGPWAFVFSLTNWQKRLFTGGQTFLLKPSTLQFWQNLSNQKNYETKGLMDLVEPKFNRLTVFDPRLPHGVREVRGTMDPRESRLVIHGWFTRPQTYIEGHLHPQRTEKILNSAFSQVTTLIDQDYLGTMSVLLKVSANGHVQNAKYLTNTVCDLQGNAARTLSRDILKIYQGLEFSKAKASSNITLPLIFG